MNRRAYITVSTGLHPQRHWHELGERFPWQEAHALLRDSEQTAAARGRRSSRKKTRENEI